MTAEFVKTLIVDRIPNARIIRVDSLKNAGGFSGAEIWKVETDDDELCVRRWPRPHPNEKRLRLIHDVLDHLAANRFELVAPPLKSALGESWTNRNGHFWEVTRWLPGKSNFWLDATEEKLWDSLTALARLHLITRQNRRWCRRAPSPGIALRIERLQALDEAEVGRLRNAISTYDLHPYETSSDARIRELCVSILSKSVCLVGQAFRELSPFQNIQELSPCLRDIWHDHVLFVENHVSGIVDFGALNIETPAFDFARLIGSLALDDARYWEIGMEAMVQVLPDMEPHIPLVQAIDFANVVLAGINWINWLYIEKRDFPERQNVIERLKHIDKRLDARDLP